MATENRVLDKGMLRDKRGESIRGDKVVVQPLDFTGTRTARNVGYANCEDVRVCVEDSLGQRSFADA